MGVSLYGPPSVSEVKGQKSTSISATIFCTTSKTLHFSTQKKRLCASFPGKESLFGGDLGVKRGSGLEGPPTHCSSWAPPHTQKNFWKVHVGQFCCFLSEEMRHADLVLEWGSQSGVLRAVSAK